MREIRRLRAASEQRLRGLDIPRPFVLEAFCQSVAAHRGRPVYLHPLPTPTGPDHPNGLTISTDHDDHLFVEPNTSAWHRDLIGCHELAHLLWGHSGEAVTLTDLLGQMAPDLDRGMVRAMLARRSFSDQQEKQAEMTASIVLDRANRYRHPSARGQTPAQRLTGAVLTRTTALAESITDYHALHQLRPLWSALTAAYPHVVLGTPPSRRTDLTRVDVLRIRLVRRAAEIRDAMLLLRGHVDDNTRQRLAGHLTSAGLTGRQHAAALEASCLTLALRAHHQRRRPTTRATCSPPGGCDLATEVSWLRAVATALTHPAVRHATTAVDRTTPPRPA